MLRSTAFQVSMLVNPNELMDFLVLAYSIKTQYPEVAKMRKQVPPDIIYGRKRSWRRDIVVSLNEKRSNQHLEKKDTKMIQGVSSETNNLMSYF